MLKFTHDGKSVLVTPMRECESGICDKRICFDLTDSETEELLQNCSERTLKLILTAVLKKLNMGAEDEIGSNQQQKS